MLINNNLLDIVKIAENSPQVYYGLMYQKILTVSIKLNATSLTQILESSFATAN